MPTLTQLCQAIEEVFPLRYQEPWDNSGLQVGDENQQVSRVLVALEMTEAVLHESIDRQCQAIVTHHPLLFHPLKRLTASTAQERIIRKAVKHDIAIYSAHTSLDNAPEGINRLLAERLGLNDIAVLRPMEQYPEAGSGTIGNLTEPMPQELFLKHVSSRLGTKNLIFGGTEKRTVRRVAVCSGAGAFLAPDAVKQGADAYITSDIKHHDFRDAENDIMLVDAGHYETEIFTKQLIGNVISQKNRNFAVLMAECETPPRHFI